jgi:copper homeostasis protein
MRGLLLYCSVASPYLLEISVETAEAAVAAERGGAHRIELCAELSLGGLTPGEELMRQARQQVRLPIFAMIRPRAGDFIYSQEEMAQIRRAIATAERLGMDGVVLGLLTEDSRVDVQRTRELVKLAQPLPVTFHRAFDDVADLDAALEDVIETSAARILTSGGAPTAPQGIGALAKLVAAAGNRITIVPGSGVNSSNILEVAQHTQAREFHSGLGTRIPYGSRNDALVEDEVRKMAHVLAGRA